MSNYERGGNQEPRSAGRAAMVEGDVMPPMPESQDPGHRYAQLGVGKPSLYPFGATTDANGTKLGLAPTASWDGDVGMQALVHVDPQSAWDALQGLAAAVPTSDPSRMPGEYLPSRELQTAWVLYRVTGDVARLRSVYDALSRDLRYKLTDPHYPGSGPVGPSSAKDLAFLGSDLVDITYAERIARVPQIAADHPDDLSSWRSLYAQYEPDMYKWFWPGGNPANLPVEYYNTATGTGTLGSIMSITDALHVPTLPHDYAASLHARFDQYYDPSAPFAGFGKSPAPGVNNIDIRYPTTSYTSYGLLDQGYPDEAEVLQNALLRDIARADMLAERFEWSDTRAPYGAGERPSLFGAVSVLDAVLMDNGYRFDQGTPSFVDLPGASGGVDGLRIADRQLDVRVDAATQQVTLSGSLVAPGCSRVRVPVGATVSLSADCSTGY